MEYLTKQSKLTREEWNSIEVPCADGEKRILGLIEAGFADVNISRNYTLTLIQHMKMQSTPQFDAYLYNQYFEKPINELCEKYKGSTLSNPKGSTLSNPKGSALSNPSSTEIEKGASAVVGGRNPQLDPLAVVGGRNPQLKKADLIRFQNTHKHIEDHKQTIFEYILLDLLEKFLKHKNHSKKVSGGTKANDEWMFYYYTIHKLFGYKVEGCNGELRKQILAILDANVTVDEQLMEKMVAKGDKLIEKNEYLLKYADETLYDHQKQLFTVCKQPNPKLVLYIAPTGTGKTMSPLGLAEKYRVIFVCAARHVGLALAKAAVSVHKKIAFAFGCNDASDIRLHYFAVKDYTKNEKSGGIGKVDNSQGEKVEIIISDVQSYLPAMLYMLAFNPKENIILYWDEPTITLDYPDHELHSLIKKNWRENLIPNVVLSSATLPQRHEIIETINDFSVRFAGEAGHTSEAGAGASEAGHTSEAVAGASEAGHAEVHEIVSYDCKKTIPMINREGFAEMPHYLFDDYGKILEVVEHCKQYKTLLRYIDLGEAIQFIMFIDKGNGMLNDRYRVAAEFTDLTTLTMYNVKMFYLNLLGNLKADAWPQLYKTFHAKRTKRYESSVNIVTTDAHTLTDGPTIFLADDVSKIAQFYIQSANIPDYVSNDIMSKIQYNRTLNEKIDTMEKKMEDAIAKQAGGGGGAGGGDKDSKSSKKSKGGSKKSDSDERISPELKKDKQQIEDLKMSVKMVMLNPAYVPNTTDHLYKYAAKVEAPQAFTCNISEDVVEQIMQITDIADYWKLLLMMGIGVFASHKSTRYVELMKQLVQDHKLYMIIASTDYIYGTNYQLCHGYIGKDLGQMSQEKCIQAMGRVGRNKLQQDYSVRFRDNELLYKLFQRDDNKPEVANMNRLFNSDV